VLALEASRFAQAGDNQHTLKDGSDIVRPSLKGASPSQGNSAAYLAARLKKAQRSDRRSEEARKAREDQVANSHLKPTNRLSSNSRDRIKARLHRDNPPRCARAPVENAKTQSQLCRFGPE
jgi:hypothetical protein